MEVVETLRALLSNDNPTRQKAEQRFEEAKQAQAAATVAGLFQVLAAEPQVVEEGVREQAAVLLRQCLANIEEATSIWASQLNDGARADVKVKLLQLLEAERQAKVCRKIADVVQFLGNQLIDIPPEARPANVEQWPELMPFLMRVVLDGSKEQGLRADALWTVKELTPSLWQMLIAGAASTLQVLKMCLGDAAPGVRANAAALFCELVEQVPNKEERKPFAPLVEDLANVLKSLADCPDAKLLNSVLQAMQGTTETADFFKDSLAQGFAPLLCTLARSHKEDDTRRLALEVLISIAESKPKMVAKMPSYLQQTLEVCIHFLMELSDDVDGWAGEDDEDAEDEEQFTHGKEVLDRLCRVMHKVDAFPVVMAALKPMLQALFQAAAWKQTVAGIVAMAQLAEYIDEEETIGQMVGAIRAQLQAPHVRVRYAAWGALAQFAEDQGELISTDEWAAQLLPEFLQGLDDPCQRSVIRAMESFQHYGEAIEREDLEPFVQPFMLKLAQKLQGALPVQKKAITFIAVIAGQIGDGFAPYYGDMMPVLKNIVQSFLHKSEERTLLGKAFECISLLAESVGSTTFAVDADVIMQAMIAAVQVPNLPNNDPVKEYMMAAAERICATMKAGFLPYLPHILPIVLEKLTLAPKEFNENSNDFEEGDEVNLTMLRVDGKVKIMVMSTSEMEDLQHAIEAVHTFVQELGKLYAPYVQQTATALLPVFDFSMSEETRDFAFETWGQLCRAAREGGQPAIAAELCQEFMKRVLPKLAEESEDTAALKTRADGITATLKKAGPQVLSAEQVRGIVQIVAKAVGDSFERRDKLEAEGGGGPDAEILQGGDGGDDEGENMLRLAFCEIAGALMQHHAEEFMVEGLPSFLPMVTKLIQPTVRHEDRRVAIFVACDFLAHLKTRVTAQWPEFMPMLLNDIVNAKPEIRQPACYGVSLAARDPAFAPVAAATAEKLAQVITETRARPKKKSEKPAQACADNALSALMEILLNHSGSLAQSEQLWGVWVSGLPCQEDEEEGVKNHKTLLTMVQSEQRAVVGEGGSNFAKVLAILVDVYKTDMVDEDTNKGICALVLKIPQATLEQHAGGLKEKQRKKLLRIHRDAQK